MALVRGLPIRPHSTRDRSRPSQALGARRVGLIALLACVAIPTGLLLLAVNAMLIERALINVARVWQGSAVDWNLLNQASHSSDPYAWATYRWSPVAAPLLAAATSPGLLVWRAAQVAALTVFRDWRAVTVLLLTAPFWLDFAYGDTMVFVLAAGWAACRGSRAGTLAWFVMTVLMPRPLMLPLTAWLLWHRPQTRGWFAAIVVTHAALVLGSGHGAEWVARLLSTAPREISHQGNIAPSRLIGVIWVPIGLSLGALLTWRGRLGLASLAMQPYLFGYYLVMLLLEIRPGSSRERAVAVPGPRPPATPRASAGRHPPGR